MEMSCFEQIYSSKCSFFIFFFRIWQNSKRDFALG